MKVLLVSGVYPPRIGGPSAQTAQIARCLRCRGFSVHVLTYGESEHRTHQDGIPITFLNSTRESGRWHRVGRNIRLLQTVGRFMDWFRPSVVHTQTASGPLELAVGWAARRRKIPAVLKFSSELTVEIANRNRLVANEPCSPLAGKLPALGLRVAQHMMLAAYDCIWTTSAFFRKRLVRRLAVPPGKVLVAPNCVDLTAFREVATSRPPRSGGDAVTLLTVCRLIPLKGIDVCIQAMSLLRDLSVRLRIVGSGEPAYEHYLHSLTRQHAVADRVEFAGSVSPAHVAEAYRSADIFVLASHYETFGIVLLEAMAAGLPVVATRVGGVSSVVEDGISAKLVSPGDPLRLANALRSLVQDYDSRRAMAAQAQRRANQFDIEVLVDKLVETYHTLTTCRRSA